MPLTNIEIEQIATDGWVARVEVGGMISKRAQVSAPSFDAVVAAMVASYSELAGIPPAADRPIAAASAADSLPPLRDRLPRGR